VPRPAKLFHFLNGEELTIADWAKRYGLETAMVKTRIYRMRWSLERALTTPKLVRGVQPKPKRTEIVAKEVREAKLCCEAFRVWSRLAPPQASDWFESLEDFNTLIRDAVKLARGENAKIFAEEMRERVATHGLRTFLSEKQLTYLCEIADWEAPARIERS
jgi:hypothetical protein